MVEKQQTVSPPVHHPHLIIKPFTKENKLHLPQPDSVLSYHKHQLKESCCSKHWKVTLYPTDPAFPLVPVEVMDGSYKKAVVQIYTHNGAREHQCSCDWFVEEQMGFCEHIVLLELLNDYYFSYPGADWFTRLISMKLKEIKGIPYAIKVYDSYNDKLMHVTRGTKDILEWLVAANKGYIETVSTKTYKKLLKESNPETEVDKVLNDISVVLKSDGLLGSNLKLYDYQEDIFVKLLRAKKAICSLRMGGGKTVISISCFGWLNQFYKTNKELNHVPRCLVVCPKSLKLQWKKEFKRALGIEANTIDSDKDFHKVGTTQVDIITYQLYMRHSDSDVFLNKTYDMVVADEIQLVRNEESKVFKAMKKLSSEFFFGLSGTVIENRLDDLYSVMDVIAPGFLGPKWKFTRDHQDLINVTKKTIVFKGVKDVDTLKEKLKEKVFGYDGATRPAVLPTHTHHSVKMTKMQRQTHDSYYGEAKKLLAKGMTQGLSYAEKMILQSYLLKARQSCNSEVLVTKQQLPAGATPSPKLLKVLELLKTQQTLGKKTVIFSQWTEMLDLVSDLLKQCGVGHVFYTGRENERKRDSNIKKFADDPKCEVFLASDSGGVGVDGLQFVCSTVIHTEIPWNPAKIDQRNGRVDRIGQTQPVDIHYLYVQDTIEERLMELIVEKRDIRTLVL